MSRTGKSLLRGRGGWPAWIALVCLLSCNRRHVPVASAAERSEAREEVRAFVDWWLEPARVAPPTIRWEERTAVAGPLTGRVRPVRPEDATWNQWPGDQYRLFNNRAALLFEVEVEGAGLLRWRPERSRLELNEDGNAVGPAATADQLLRPLLAGAQAQERWALEGDLVARTRAAGPFRSLYLPLSEEEGTLRGLVAFPLADANAHVAALRLSLAVEHPSGVEVLRWEYE